MLFRGAMRLYKRKIDDLGEHQTIAQNIDLAEFGCAGLWDAWMERWQHRRGERNLWSVSRPCER